MNVRIFGAGIEGSIYAAKLAAAGNAVTMVARGDRFKELQSKGVQLKNVLTGELSVTPVSVVDHIDSTTSSYLALVTVRREQVADALPALAPATQIRSRL
jgi:2-dehydropantoate 2-reductase